jgi:hypothetical protein
VNQPRSPPRISSLEDSANASRLLLTKSAAQTPPGEPTCVFAFVMLPGNAIDGTSQFADVGHN